MYFMLIREKKKRFGIRLSFASLSMYTKSIGNPLIYSFNHAAYVINIHTYMHMHMNMYLHFVLALD